MGRPFKELFDSSSLYFDGYFKAFKDTFAFGLEDKTVDTYLDTSDCMLDSFGNLVAILSKETIDKVS